MNILVSGGTGFVGSWMKKMQPKEVTATYLSRKEYETYLNLKIMITMFIWLI